MPNDNRDTQKGIERHETAHQKCAAGSILLREDITTWEDAIKAAQETGGEA